MMLEVTDIRDEAERVRSFTLRDPDGKPLPAFAPGAHLALTLDVGGTPLTRHYSLVSDPRELGAYRIAVLHAEQSRGGSRHLHERVRVGARLVADGPHEDFHVHPSAGHSLLIAGGIGITPILSMLRALAHAGRSFELHYVTRSAARMAFREECARLAGSRLSLYTGRAALDVEALLAGAPPGAHVYACGPRPLIEAVREHAARLGRPSANVHFESFGAQPSAADRPLRVRLALSALEVEVPPGQSVLDALIDAGAFVSYDCKRGECGSCAATVLQGRPLHRDVCLTEAARRTTMCPCVSWAQDEELVLDL